jgi:DNA-binding FadR family transcriptional regulator
MTRSIRTLTPRRNARKEGLLRPLAPSPKLTQVVLERISGEIMGGRLAPGDKLPTEQQLMNAYGVSRTVVREAVAALKADGLVRTRQGSGAYVAETSERAAFRIADDAATVETIIDVMELRRAVEVEAAGLAAERASAADKRSIVAALNAFSRAVESGEDAIAEDFALHVAIAEAAHNAQFINFLTFLGRHVIPRQSIRTQLTSPAEQRTYLARLKSEHARIVTAIGEGQIQPARRNMRTHIDHSLQRYHRFFEQLQRSKKPHAHTRRRPHVARPSATVETTDRGRG